MIQDLLTEIEIDMEKDTQKACQTLFDLKNDPNNQRYLEGNIFDKYITLEQRCNKQQ
jgi:hypothetical protein